jgi:hypothetical protein
MDKQICLHILTDTNKSTYIKGVWEQGVEENIYVHRESSKTPKIAVETSLTNIYLTTKSRRIIMSHVVYMRNVRISREIVRKTERSGHLKELGRRWEDIV